MGLRFVVWAVVLVASCQALLGLSLSDSGQGSFPLASGGARTEELSGITFGGGNTYYAVSDSGAPVVWVLEINIDPASGRIRSAGVANSLSLPGMGRDTEGIAYRAAAGTLLVADESTSTINEFQIKTGRRIGVVRMPEIFRKNRRNFGLESLSFADGRLWTVNEEALGPDGPRSSPQGGSWVRLQRFSRQGRPDGQWAYRTDAITQLSPFTPATRSGVVDLLALPGGGLLVLERELGGFVPEFRSRIYAVNFTGATDISRINGLAAGKFVPVKKTLLWEKSFRATNYEGITLGPKLTDGTQSVLLISDDGNGVEGQTQSLYALILRP